MPNRYFGTDGIRGKYKSSFLNEKFIRYLGYSIAEEFRSANNKNVLIGYDTRQSCKEIVNILSEGLYSNGFKIFSLGIAPTPAVSKLTRDKDFSIGIMISASHNPYHDNGLKIFDENGIKLSSNVEASIEKKIKLYSQHEIFQAESKIENSSNLLDEYKKNCIQKFKNTNLSKNKIIIDTANGANSFLAYEIYSQLFDEVKVISNVPDGTNINNQCGSTYLKNILNEMKKGSFDFGLSMDGDGDRVIIINSNYEIIDGDDILYVIAKGKLINNEKIEKVIGTKMSNQSLENSLNNLNIDFFREDVGDKNVLNKMLEENSILGGEPSGHIISLDIGGPTGDAIISSLAYLYYANILSSKNLLPKLKNKYIQVLENIPLDSHYIKDLDQLSDKIESLYKDKFENSRFLIRKSGTENLLRVMVESPSNKELELLLSSIKESINLNLSKNE
tara:strand:+ start:1347 stop:2687 length:1341 start_codon:yes stop_codon:yes gene_type:complete